MYCGATLRPGDTFCIHCGRAIADAARNQTDNAPQERPAIPKTGDAEPEILTATFPESGSANAGMPTIFTANQRACCALTRVADGVRVKFTTPCVIGRGIGTDTRFVENLSISRQHALIAARDDTFTIEDLNSTNGTFVNDSKVPAGIGTPLENGARVRLGSEDFVFTVEEQE